MDSTPQKTGIIYCRVSTKEQIDGTSLDSQERHCREFAERQGIKVLKVFTEQGESAKTVDRTEFTKAITLCAAKNSRIDYFVVYKLDRFARNQDDHVTMRAILKRSGTELRSVTEPINETPMGRALEGMLSVFAELDNNVRAERSKGGMVERVKQGVWCWPCPLGYHRPVNALNIAPEPIMAPYIRLAFEEYTKGVYTYKALANFLAERGFRTRQGKNPSAQLMEKILKNPLYYGIMDVWGEKVKGTFEPIITETLFAQCQEGYKHKSAHAAPRSANNPLFPLRRLAVCNECHNPLTGSSSTGRQGQKYPYYHHSRQGCSKARFIPKETLEQLFFEYLQEITPDAKYEKLFKAIITDIWKNNYKKLDEDNLKIRKEIFLLEEERQAIFDLHRAGKYTDGEFGEQKALVNQKIEQKRLLIQDKWVEEIEMEKALDYCFQFVRNTAKTWVEADYPVRLRFQKKIFDGNIEFDGEKFGNTKLSLIYQLNQDSGNKKSELVPLRGIGPRLHG